MGKVKTIVNFGVIGCGYWGPNLIRNFRALPDGRVTKMCDRSNDRLEHMRSLYPEVDIANDCEDLIGDPEIDAIAIATPVHTHYELALRSLQAGKHTFIEKPMATTPEQCMELTKLAYEKSLVLMVGHTFLYSPVVRKIKEIIDSGDIGDVLYISSRRLNLGLLQQDINVAWDLAPHDISIIVYLLDEIPASVNCQGKAHIDKAIEEVTSMTLNFDNGGFATIQSSWLDPNKVREMIIVGSKKMIVYNDIEPMEKIRIYDKRVEAPPHYDSYEAFHYSYHYGDMHAPWIQQTEP